MNNTEIKVSDDTHSKDGDSASLNIILSLTILEVLVIFITICVFVTTKICRYRKERLVVKKWKTCPKDNEEDDGQPETPYVAYNATTDPESAKEEENWDDKVVTPLSAPRSLSLL